MQKFLIDTCTHNYVLFTLTFKPIITCQLKFKRINSLEKIFKRLFNLDHEVIYSIEYHKKKDCKTPNVFMPHVHGIFKCKKITEHMIIDLERQFEAWGRTQFILQEDQEEIKAYKDYLYKDVELNNLTYTPFKHFKYFKNVKVDKEIKYDYLEL